MPNAAVAAPAPADVPEPARGKLRDLAAREAIQVAHHQRVLGNLASRVNDDCFAQAAPWLFSPY